MKRDSQRERPPPLRINRPGGAAARSSNNNHTAAQVAGAAQLGRQPLIIHTFSPEVIQTDPRNFMSLVQKLTGQAATAAVCLSPSPSPVLPTKKPRFGVGLGLGFPVPADQNSDTVSADESSAPLTPNGYNLASQHQRLMMFGFSGLNENPVPAQQSNKSELGLSLPQLSASLPDLQPLSISSATDSENPKSAAPKMISLNRSQEYKMISHHQQQISEGDGGGTAASPSSVAISGLLSPSNFNLSPSHLPSPSTFMQEFQFLFSPAAAAAVAACPSPRLGMATPSSSRSTLGAVSSTAPVPPSSTSTSGSIAAAPKVGLTWGSFAAASPWSTSTSSSTSIAAPPWSSSSTSAVSQQFSPLGFPSPGPITRALMDLPPLSPATYGWLEKQYLCADAARTHGLPPRPPPPQA